RVTAKFTSPDHLAMLLHQALVKPAIRGGSAHPEQGAATRAVTALPALASPAQQRLQDLAAALQSTTRTPEQGKHTRPEPAGMDDWESFEDQDRTHEQLAASVTDPAADLKACSKEAFEAARDAGDYVRRLGAKQFAKRASRLAPIIKTVTGLEATSGEL